MKKFTSGLIIGVMLCMTMVYAAASLTAVPYAFPVYIKGVPYSDTTNPAVTINNTVYMPVNVLGQVFGEKVVWNDAKKCLEIGAFKSETIEFSNIIIKKSVLGMTTVEGEVKNNDKVQRTGIVRISFYDDAGKLLGSASGSFSELQPGQVKVFDALATEDYTAAKSYKIQIDSMF